MPPIISVENLTKTYRLGAIGGGTLQGDVARWWARARKRPDPTSKIGQAAHPRQIGELFWALEDVNFSVGQGEVLGIIGRNGAGKSTLLKILSQVTAPTSGLVRLHGRVASLLEVGTGFHPELTGRENVFLNGAILGMHKPEIRRKFDEIVAFSECEAFIDTPVKRYSSGMYVRLAFAVAAHLEPEILIVDEVLAVGDAQFQDKCLGKMGEVSRGGRTVLFVSHNMAAVRRLCRRAVLLEGGRVAMTGDAAAAVAQYLGSSDGSRAAWARSGAAAEGIPSFRELRVANESGEPAGTIASTDKVRIEAVLTVPARTPPAQIAVRVTNHEGVAVFTSANTDAAGSLIPLTAGEHRFSVDVPANFLAAGHYHLQVAAHIPRVTVYDLVESVSFTVEDTGTAISDGRLGIVTPLLHWRHAAPHGSQPGPSETLDDGVGVG